MDYETVKAYLLNKPEAIEDYPFGPNILIAKIKGKMFASLTTNQGTTMMNLKCDPAHAQELRDVFDAVKPGYHMNKKHWNTLALDGSLPDSELERLIDHSYTLVFKKLKKSERQAMEVNYGAALLYRE
jgi:predicted DNA-binding protein (MmcQ/YjbR family)